MFEDYFLNVSEDYEPGHVPMYYGNGLSVLATLIKPGSNHVEGDLLAEYTINGEWDLRLINVETQEEDYRTNRWDDITPDMEKAILGDGVYTDLEGVKYNLEWAYNNWFEVFAYKYFDGRFREVSFDIVEDERAPSAVLLRETLVDYLENLELD